MSDPGRTLSFAGMSRCRRPESILVQALLPFALPALTSLAGRAAGLLPDGLAHQPAAASMQDGHDRAGFELGWDHARYQLTPPLGHLQATSAVRQGWSAGRAAFGERTLKAGASVRQWLALRLEAWQHGQEFETLQVSPHFLAQIDAAVCPVSRVPLMLGTGRADDATVQRLNPAAAYAAGNLVVTSRAVQAAREQAGGAMDFDALWSQAQRIAAGECSAVRELDGAAWTRLAVLASFATPLPHARAACLPLAVLPPNRVRVINPVQALQVMLTLQFVQAGYARRLLELAALMPSSEARQAFQIFMHTLLARRLAAGPGAALPEVRRALEDSWADPLVNRRWQRLALRLGAADCERLLQRAAQRGLNAGGSRWLSDSAATDGWALPVGAPARGTAGRATPARQVAQGEASPAYARSGSGACSDRPGSARSRGSQKLAS